MTVFRFRSLILPPGKNNFFFSLNKMTADLAEYQQFLLAITSHNHPYRALVDQRFQYAGEFIQWIKSDDVASQFYFDKISEREVYASFESNALTSKYLQDSDMQAYVDYTKAMEERRKLEREKKAADRTLKKTLDAQLRAPMEVTSSSEEKGKPQQQQQSEQLLKLMNRSGAGF